MIRFHGSRLLINLFLSLILIFIGSCKQDHDPEPEPVTYFPVLEVSGTHYDIGYAVGQRFQEQIGVSFEAMQELQAFIETLIAQDPQRFYQCYVDTVNALYPQFIQELQGMADGSGLPFRNFFIECMIPEYAYLLGMKDCQFGLGCSTVSFVHNGTLYLAHNEDGNRALQDDLFILKAHPVGKPSFVGLCLPGLIPGVAPAMNDRGIFYSGNYITGTELHEGGIPACFVERSLMEATTIDEAIAKATVENRAFCYHVNIASRNEGRIVGIEVAPSTYHLEEVEGFYIHTNHFIQPGMETYAVPNENSISRLQVLENLTGQYDHQLDAVSGDLLTQFLSSHDNWINAPCSHATAENHLLQTFGNTLFDLTNGTWRLSFKNPCERRFQTVSLNLMKFYALMPFQQHP